MEQQGISPTPEARPAIRRMSAYRFFALLMLPTVALLVLACGELFINLNQIQNITNALRKEHLPGILASQRTLTNLETLRRNAETVYTAEDPRQRRVARLNAQALVTESVFETSPHFVDFAVTVQKLIRELDDTKRRSEEAADSLHRAELRLARVLALLYRTFRLPNMMHLSHNAKHLTSSAEDLDPERVKRAAEQIRVLREQCGRGDLAAATREDCATLETEWNGVGRFWQERIKADQESRIIWERLDALLMRLSDATSTSEVKRAYTAMESIREEARRVRVAFYVSTLLLACIVFSFVVLLHRYLLSPIALAAHALQRIRFGRPTAPLPQVRIRELQDLLDLVPSLSAHLTELSTRSGKLEQEKNKYASLSLIDALTGVDNRRSFDVQLASESARKPLALLMLDVDMFKAYNDALGHQAGDICLATVARGIERALLRSGDKVFRYGGEEFAVLLPDVPEAAALAVAARIMAEIRGLKLPHPASPVAPFVTVSIGVASRAADEAVDDDILVARADKALYRAKNTGRNRVCAYAGDGGDNTPHHGVPTSSCPAG